MPKKRVKAAIKPRKPSLESIKNLVIISDTHVGCKLALCHPDGAALDEGGKYMPSLLQLKLWAVWENFWNLWVPQATRGDPFIVIHNGDAIDGNHHGSTTQWSHNLADQRKHAQLILKDVVDRCAGRYYHIRGTEAHVGSSGTEEEQLAKSLGAIQGANGNYARWELLKTIGDRHTAHFTHHIGTTSSAAHETSAVNAELASAFTEAGRWLHAPPSIICRSHRHRCSEIRLPSKYGYVTAFVTGCFQMKTPFVYRLAGGRSSAPQIGGSLIRLGDEEIFTRHSIVEVGRVEAE